MRIEVVPGVPEALTELIDRRRDTSFRRESLARMVCRATRRDSSRNSRIIPTGYQEGIAEDDSRTNAC